MKTSRFRRSNMLALAVLVCLSERPMHPYEMATLMRQRGKHESIKLNYGSLYTVVQSLQSARLIEPKEVEREGRRPERTVYRLAEAGQIEMVDWLSQLISTPVKEYPSFEAALSLLPALPPDEVVALLDVRCLHLEMELARHRSVRQVVAEHELPELFWVEDDFASAMTDAELGWTRRLSQRIKDGEMEGVEVWRQLARERGV